ncbi:zinc finger protein ZAT2 [Salvia miltiorrhiza]|uniref:zinc finger protein ZAT2 n=1 Tax=Salvia miltiorrhiza TaxID=226208 RepID=UPI0025ACC375|nr:zinc finger protein ZAT2 [Salvia miltiorrhiza]
MGEVEEQRYVCRICSKACVSGKSLGGHMRVHLAQIAASKKAAEIKMEDYDDDDDRQLKDSCINQSNSSEEEEKTMNAEAGEGDQSNNSYELRENPKKSWRISDPKRALSKTTNSCRECGRKFGSLRALSGHMRCHSSKNKKEVHCCKECGRGFESVRAMFGHMKSHSKRVMKVCDSVVESGESLSDMENFCPIRRKRSRIRYKGTVNPSSRCGASEVEEAEEAARCLVMLSRGMVGVGNAGDSDDDSAYFGGVVASCGSRKLCGSDGGVVANASHIENVKSVDLVCDDEFLEDGIGSNGGDLEKMLESKHDHDECGGVEMEMEMEESSKGKEHECPICFKVFGSGQALGGHKRAHYNGVVESRNQEVLDLNFPVAGGGGLGLDFSLSSWFLERSREHEALLLTT